jgi:hypothetical protein
MRLKLPQIEYLLRLLEQLAEFWNPATLLSTKPSHLLPRPLLLLDKLSVVNYVYSRNKAPKYFALKGAEALAVGCSKEDLSLVLSLEHALYY